MMDFLKSDYIKEYIEKTGFKFTDRGAAAIIYNSGYNYPETHRRLKEISERTDDEELKTEIEERIAYDTKCIGLFAENSDRGCVYETSLRESDDDYDEDEVLGRYIDYNMAFADMMKRGVGFIIEKYQIIGMPERFTEPHGGFNPRLFEEAPKDIPRFDGEPIGGMHFDKSGNIESCYTCEIPKKETDRVFDWGEKRFENSFIELPNPFEAGDIVCMAGAPGRLGVVETSQNGWMDFLKWVKEKNAVVDFSDASIVVEFLEQDGEFVHEHIPPVFLEKASPGKKDKLRMLLESASRLIAGKGSLDEFLWRQKEYREYWEKLQKGRKK